MRTVRVRTVGVTDVTVIASSSRSTHSRRIRLERRRSSPASTDTRLARRRVESVRVIGAWLGGVAGGASETRADTSSVGVGVRTGQVRTDAGAVLVGRTGEASCADGGGAGRGGDESGGGVGGCATSSDRSTKSETLESSGGVSVSGVVGHG